MDQSLAEGIDKMGARELSDYAQGCPREELLRLVLQQRATCERERQRRQAVEQELGKLKQMYEGWDDMWLNVLSQNC
jgi:Holliday junction resolvasome RuvABC ATP-dependent DNA helicase subunit